MVKYLFFGALLFIAVSCKDENVTNPDIIIPDSNVSYSQHIQPLFNSRCVNCHGVGTFEAGLDLTTHAGTTADPRIVFTGEPENSLLVWTIERRPGFPPMPPLASQYLPLNENQVNGIKAWIREGALNN